MKKLYMIYFVVYLSMFALIFSSCSGGSKIPDPVCEYGEVTCNTLQYLCENYPEISPEICEYSRLACISLSVLCSSDPESPEYEAAQTSLVYINQRLKALVKNKLDHVE